MIAPTTTWYIFTSVFYFFYFFFWNNRYINKWWLKNLYNKILYILVTRLIWSAAWTQKLTLLFFFPPASEWVALEIDPPRVLYIRSRHTLFQWASKSLALFYNQLKYTAMRTILQKCPSEHDCCSLQLTWPSNLAFSSPSCDPAVAPFGTRSPDPTIPNWVFSLLGFDLIDIEFAF